MPDIDPIYKTKDGQQVTKRQLLESGYSEDRITKGLSNGILAQIGDTEARGQTFRTKDGQVVDYEQLINSGYSEERINKGIQNGILTASDIEKKNLSKPTGMPLSTGTESMPSPTLPLATSPFDYKRQQETGGLAEASTELRTERYFHNAPKESDLISEVKKYIPADDAALSQSILNGDLNSIKKAKEDYISKIDKQKQDIKNSLQGGQDEFSGISKSVQLQPQLDALDKDKENVEGIFNQFAQHSAVSNRMRLVQEEGTEQGLSDGILAKEIGHQIEKEILPTKDFNKRESVYNNAKAYPLFKKAIDDGQITDPDVIKRVNSDAFQEIRNRELYVKENIDYDREKSGLSAMMQTISLKANDLISKGLTEKNPDLIKQGNELINKYNVLKSKDDKLLERYPDVGIAQGNQIVSDRISKMGIRGFINSDAIKAAIATEENETGTFLKQYGKFIDYVKPAMLPKGGLVENLGLGIEQIGNELFGGSDLQEIARTYNPSLKTTSFSGGQPTKIAYDNNGKAYREMPNENYNTWDFNNSMRVIGHGLPALIEFVILEKGIGAVAGLAGEVSASAITNLAKLGSKITKAPITAEEIATAREALQFSKGLENTTGLTGAMYWTSYEQNRQLADELVDGDSGKDEFKKNVLANVLTLVSAGAFRAVGFSPAQTVQKAFSKGILPDALKIIEKQGLEGLGKQEVAEGFFKDVVLPKATAIVKSLGVSVKGGIKGAEAVVLDKNLQGLLASMVNPEKGELPSFKEDTDMAISQILLMTVAGLPGLVNAKTKSTLTKDAMYEAGLRHPQFEGLINKGVENGRYSQEQANEMISVLKTIGEESYKVQGETTKDGLPLTVKQKRDLAFNNFKIRAAKMLEEKGHNVDAESVKTETQAENETILSNSRFEPVVVDENGDVSEQKTVELTPEEIIIQEAGKKKLIGPFNDLVKADPKLAEDVLLDYAKQKYAISDNGEILEEGGREITNKEVDNAVNKKFPNKESVINAITKPKTQTNEEAKTNEANQTEVLTPPVSSVEVGEVMKDDKGEPISFFHGTNRKDLTELEPSTAQQFGKGIYFGSDKNADAIKDFGDGGKIFEVNLPSNLLDAGGREYSEIVNRVEAETGIDPASDKFPLEKVNDEVKKRGYKGLITDNDIYGGKEAMVFDKKDVTYKPEQSQPKGEAQPTSQVSNTVSETTPAAVEEGKSKPLSEEQRPKIHVEYPPTNINYMGTGKLETEFGIGEREPTQRKRDIYTIKEADELLEKGWDIQKELNKVDSGEKTFISDAEYINFTRYAAELADRLRTIKDSKSAEYDKTLGELSRVANAANVAGKESGRSLGIRGRFSTAAEGSYGEFMLTELAANNDAPLTDKQKETANAEFEILDAKRKKLDEDTKAFEEKVAAFKAEREFGKAKKYPKDKTKDYAAERKQIVGDILLKLSKARGEQASFLGVAELASIAPDVLRLVKNVATDVSLKLAEVVEKVYETLKEGIPDIEKKHIHDIISGQYNEKKITKNEAAIRMENLRIEAQLLNKYERLLKGEEPKNEKAKIKRNQEIEGLRKKIKDFRKEETEANKFYPEEKDSEAKKLGSLQKRNETETKKIKELIAKGDFDMPVKKIPLMEDRELQKKFPAQFKETQKSLDEYIKVKREISLRRLRQMYENKTPEEKMIEIFSKSLNVPRTIMASFDFSAPLRQAIIATTAHPQIASKALKFMFEAAKDEKVYNRWLEDVHNNPRWHIAEKTGLGITDPQSLHVKSAEEAFQGAPYAEKIPIVGLGVKASERAYIGFLNKLRWDLFNMYADRFEFPNGKRKGGKTYENNPKLYEGLSSFINSATGRGGMKGLENAAPIFNWFLFASKLIASRLNMLGLSDIPNLAIRGATFGKYGVDYGFYTRLPKELRIEAAKDMAKFLAVGVATLIIAQQLGASVELDPRSSDFGKIKVGNTRWDIWGGFQPYARVTTQVLSGQRKTTTTGKIQDLDKKSFMGQNRFTPLGNFARGKLAPIPATVIDLATHKDAAGQPVTVKSELLSLVTPLMFKDTYEAMQDQGVKALFTVGIPSAFGVGTQTYESQKKKNR